MATNPNSSSNNSSPTISSNEDINENKDHGGVKSKQINDKNSTPSAETQQGEEIELIKAEMSEVMEENQRLKQYLDQIMKDYQALQKKFYENSKKCNDTTKVRTNEEDDDVEELVSLSLGRTMSVDSKKSVEKSCINITNSTTIQKNYTISESKSNDIEEMKEKSLDLGLNCKSDVPKITCIDQGQSLMPTSSSLDGEEKDREISNNTISKNNGSRVDGDDEVVQQPPMKKARVSVRARCDTPTMNDGCQWRKYGQKIAKGNPCPRAYYRCTVAPSCPVRKQVQRCADDMSILITTYEGTHNHPLPMSATAIASTTSAAAYMLTSGSSSTTPNQGLHSHYTPTTTPSIGTDLIHGTFNPKQLYPPNNYSSSSSSFSTQFNTHPTITLDLTTSNSPSTSQSFLPRPNSSTTLSFSSLNYSSNNYDSTMSTTWPYVPNYVPQRPSMKQVSNPSSTGHIALLPKHHNNGHINGYVPDTITQAAAKVLTSDPSFQSVITAALSSFITNNNNINGNIGSQSHSSSFSSMLQSTSKGNNNNACGSSLLNMTGNASTATNCQSSPSLMLLSSSLSSFSGSKSPATSPDNDRDRVN